MNDISRQRFRRLITIALPIMISQASETVMMFVDRLFLSRVGMVSLAASMSGGLAVFMFTSFFASIVGYVSALVAQYHGSSQHVNCPRATSQAIYLSLFSYPVLLLFMPLVKFIFILAGQTEAQISLATDYGQILLVGSIFLLLRQAITGFFTGIGKTRIIMIANIAGMIVNIPLDYIFIFGAFGIPAMGIKGAAIGTICGSFTVFAILSVSYLRTVSLPGYQIKGMWKFRGDLLKKLFRFGLPTGVDMFLNHIAFNIFIQLMHSYGPKVAAAVSITFNWDLVAFIPVLGMGIAATALVGQHIGAKDYEGAEKSAYLSLRVGLVYSALMMILFITAAKPLVLFFASGFPDAGDDMVRLATTMLRLASLYTLADATQIILTGALRGSGDTAFIMRASIILNWIMAGCAIILVKVVHAGPMVLWSIIIATVIFLGALMLFRFRSGKWREIKLID